MRDSPKEEVIRIRSAAHRRLAAELIRAARAAAPREACGLLFGSAPAQISEAVELPNRTAPGGVGRFRLDPVGWVQAEDAARARGLALVGFWHSHPSGVARPSPADAAAAWPGSLHAIVTPDGALRFFRRQADPAGFLALRTEA